MPPPNSKTTRLNNRLKIMVFPLPLLDFISIESIFRGNTGSISTQVRRNLRIQRRKTGGGMKIERWWRQRRERWWTRQTFKNEDGPGDDILYQHLQQHTPSPITKSSSKKRIRSLRSPQTRKQKGHKTKLVLSRDLQATQHLACIFLFRALEDPKNDKWGI